MVSYALAQVGRPYRFGASGPAAFDCSGLLVAAWARVGVRLPHKAAALASVGRPIGHGDIRAGDILVMNGGGHAAMALGGGMMVHASRAGRPVAVVRIYQRPMTVRRIIG